jgi:hypothetical protein
MTEVTDARIRNQNARAVPGKQKKCAGEKSEAMLRDCDRPKIREKVKEREEEARVKEIAAVSVAEFGAGQFSQRRREITPGIGIRNWIERQGESLPDCPAKDESERSATGDSPRDLSSAPALLAACERRDRFQGFANV